MITYGFLALVALVAAITLSNWRMGCFFWLAIAILQDPVRKVTPGTPAYLTMSFLPVYLAAFLGASQQSGGINAFVRQFPQLYQRFQLFAVALAASLLTAIFVTGHGIVAAGLGVISYAGGVPALLLGYWYLRRDYKELEPLLISFVLLTSLMLIGVPLEHSGVKFSLPWLGTIATDQVWYRWFNNFDYVAMISGFHRSPEIMGWHAMALSLISYYLILRRPNLTWLWSLTAVWGIYAVFMSGRRKMLLMIVAFLLVFFWSSAKQNRRRIMVYVVICALVFLPTLAFSVDSLYLKSLDTGLTVTGAKLSEKGWSGPIWLLGIVGPFGYGVGSLTQGAQHSSQAIEGIPLVEGGLEKVMVELGIFGLFCVFLFGYELSLASLRNVRSASICTPTDFGPAFCFAFVAANLVAFLIAFQFLGDPFIGSFVGFLMGLLLSHTRLLRESKVDRTRSNQPQYAVARSPSQSQAAIQ